MRAPLEQRFWAKVVKTPYCWLWIGHKDRDGYGRIREKEKMRGAHHIAYELNGGSIPKDQTIDHLCRVRSCVNPAHMEVVTAKENTLRGIGPTAINAQKTHCSNGHEFNPANTYWRANSGNRQCRACNKMSVAKYRKRRI